MAVNLQYSYCEGELVHISERTYKDKTYTCPCCNEILIARKGRINTHHFAHKPDSICTANEETLLHLFTKLLFATRNELTLNIPKKHIHGLRSFFDATQSFLATEYIPVSLDSILDYYDLSDSQSFVEKAIGVYIADVLFADSNSEEALVIEILVTHEIEPNKRDFFLKNDILYLEIKPLYNKKGIIEFYVSDSNVTEFLENMTDEINETLFSYVTHNFKDQLVSHLEQELNNEQMVQLQRKAALRQLNSQVDSLNLRDFIDRQRYMQMASIPAKATNSYDRHERVESVVRRRKYLICNGKFVNYETGILESMLTNFMREGIYVDAFVDVYDHSGREAITGFNFRIPRATMTGVVMKEVLTEMINQLMKEND